MRLNDYALAAKLVAVPRQHGSFWKFLASDRHGSVHIIGYRQSAIGADYLYGQFSGDHALRINTANDKRRNGALNEFAGQSVSLTSCAPLEDRDGGINPSASKGPFRNRAILAVLALLLLVVAAILLNYGIWNLYNGPNDWRATACVIGGWFPFTAGLWLLFYRVFI